MYRIKFLSVLTVFGFQIVSSSACCSEPSTIIQIKNYEGPIYLHAPQTGCEDKILHHVTPSCDFDCSCASKPVTTCFPINTATASTGGLYPYPQLYQDKQQCTPGLYNVPYNPSYQDCPVIQITPQSVFCPVSQDDCSYTCGKCGKRY